MRTLPRMPPHFAQTEHASSPRALRERAVIANYRVAEGRQRVKLGRQGLVEPETSRRFRSKSKQMAHARRRIACAGEMIPDGARDLVEATGALRLERAADRSMNGLSTGRKKAVAGDLANAIVREVQSFAGRREETRSNEILDHGRNRQIARAARAHEQWKVDLPADGGRRGEDLLAKSIQASDMAGARAPQASASSGDSCETSSKDDACDLCTAATLSAASRRPRA